ncbi:unnamed protein product [Sympodiomycopsis kandeliae]
MLVTRPTQFFRSLNVRNADLASQLIKSAQPQIPKYGFTHAALSEGSKNAGINIDDWTLNSLFPGGSTGETSVPVRLFRRWDHDSLERAIEKVSQRHQTTTGVSGGEEEVTRQKAATILEARLRLSHAVRHHLEEPFSQLSAVEIPGPLRSLLTARLPLPFSLASQLLPSSVPNPLPLLQRSFTLVDDALHIAHTRQDQVSTQGKPDEIPIYGTKWYTTRTHMALAYLSTELHLISPAYQSIDHSIGIFYSILDSQLDLPSSTTNDQTSSLLQSGKQWIEVAKNVSHPNH